MSTHPDLETLFSAAADARPPAVVSAHLAQCSTCSVAFGRLQHGAKLIAEAKLTPVDVHWEAMDEALMVEADRVAANIRAGNVRSIRPWGRWATGGLTLAAAAAALLAVRTGYIPLMHGLLARNTTGDVHLPMVVPEAAPWQGSVLLSAGGASVQDASGSHALGAVATIQEGSRITTGTRGRGVVTVQPGWTMDVRPGSDVQLTRLRSGEVTVALADGAVALQPGEGADHAARVALHAGRWTVTNDGPVLAQMIPGMVHVVVLGSAVSVGREGAPAVRYGGPIVLDLPEIGAGAQVEDGVVARDPDALDVSVLSPRGQLWTLPAIDPTAQVTATGHGTLPSGLEVLRLSNPLTLRARTTHGTSTLEIGTGHTVEWVRSAQAGSAPTAVASADPGLAQATPVISAEQMHAHEGQAIGRFQHCVSVCQARGRCAGPLQGSVELNLGTDGRVTSVAVDPSVHDAQTCIEHEAQFLAAFPGGLHVVRIPLH